MLADLDTGWCRRALEEWYTRGLATNPTRLSYSPVFRVASGWFVAAGRTPSPGPGKALRGAGPHLSAVGQSVATVQRQGDNRARPGSGGLGGYPSFPRERGSSLLAPMPDGGDVVACQEEQALRVPVRRGMGER